MNNSNDIRNNNNGNKYELSILNIHGYHGSPENAAYAALGKQCKNITSPSVDYDAKSPESITDDLRQIINERNIDAIVGTSLGGYTDQSMPPAVSSSSTTRIRGRDHFIYIHVRNAY